MTPQWLEDVALWGCFFIIGYYACYFKLEKQFMDRLLTQTSKLQRKIRELQEKS